MELKQGTKQAHELERRKRLFEDEVIEQRKAFEKACLKILVIPKHWKVQLTSEPRKSFIYRFLRRLDGRVHVEGLCEGIGLPGQTYRRKLNPFGEEVLRVIFRHNAKGFRTNN